MRANRFKVGFETMMDNIYFAQRKTLYKELKPLFESFASANYAIIKGEVLSKQIYGVPDKRRSSDIDILIDKQHLKQWETQLCSLGFTQMNSQNRAENRRNRVLCMAYSHQIPSYHKDKFGFHLNVDLNYDVFWGEYEGSRFSIEEFLSDAQEMDVYGVKVKALTVEKAFIQLLLHHYKEMNSLYHLSHYNCIRTHMFRDIYDMLSYHADVLKFKRVKELAERFCIEDIVYYMLYYTNQVFAGKLDRFVAAFKNPKGSLLLDQYGLCDKERKVWKLSFQDRLDKDDLWELIRGDMTDADLEKIELNNVIFT